MVAPESVGAAGLSTITVYENFSMVVNTTAIAYRRNWICPLTLRYDLSPVCLVVVVYLASPVRTSMKYPKFIYLPGHQDSAKQFGDISAAQDALFSQFFVVTVGDGKLDFFTVVKSSIPMAVIMSIRMLVDNGKIVDFFGFNAERLGIIYEK